MAGKGNRARKGEREVRQEWGNVESDWSEAKWKQCTANEKAFNCGVLLLVRKEEKQGSSI